jgi:hypothetical protein
VRHQPNWRQKSASSSTTNPWVSSSDHTGEEEVTHPMGQDRAKAAAREGKANEGSSGQSEASSVVDGMMSTLKKLNTSFAKAQLWKQCNKFKERSTIDMDGEELQTHREAFGLIQKDLQFAQAIEAAIKDEDDE